MARESYRSRALSQFTRLYEQARNLFVVDQLLDSNEESLDLESPTFLFYLQNKLKLDSALSSRYSASRICRRPSMGIFADDLRGEDNDSTRMNDSEFKRKYRMSRQMLDKVTERIQDNGMFEKGKRGPSQQEVKHQLMILLHFLGKEGETNHSQRSTFKISEGHCKRCRERVVKALVSMREEYIRWLDEQERKEIAARIESEFVFPNCVGMMDGTLAELAIAPQCDDKSNYSGRKFGYSLTINVINDD